MLLRYRLKLFLYLIIEHYRTAKQLRYYLDIMVTLSPAWAKKNLTLSEYASHIAL